MNKAVFRFLIIFIFSSSSGYAQKTEPVKMAPEDVENYKRDAVRLISFLEYSMNIIGSDSSTEEEKEAVIYSSYLKIFRDKKVLIEDDLDGNRKVPTSKLVQAYLQDIAYFYKKIKFALEIENIEFAQSETRFPYFKITIDRHLRGINLDQDTVENLLRRYVELNIDPRDKELKIVSIYTTQPNEREELISWWKGLPVEWQMVLTKEAALTDSVSYEQLKKVRGLETLDLSGNTGIRDFNPLSGLSELKQINLSGTSIVNLDVLRNLLQLELLKLDNTPVVTIPPLIYLRKLSALYIDHTGISSLDFVKFFPCLRKLSCAGTPIHDLSPVSGLKLLEELDVSNTAVASLQPIAQLKGLKKIICDATPVSEQEIIEFRRQHTDALVIYESERLVNWWNNLDPEWKSFFKQRKQLMDTPSKEQLTALVKIDSVDVSGNQKIVDLLPLKILSNLKVLRFSNTGVNTLDPLADMLTLQTIDLSNTKIKDLAPLKDLPRLSLLICEHTSVDSLPLAQFILSHRKSCLVVYKSTELLEWWEHLTNEWRKTFRNYLRLDASPTVQQLHQLIKLDSVDASGKSIENIGPLGEFLFLKYLGLSKCGLGTIPDLRGFVYLTTLNISDNPIIDLQPIENISGLKNINCSNTAIRDLMPLQKLIHLEVLKCSGTRIKDVEPVSKLFNLSFLDISNTVIKSVVPLDKLKKMNTLICYNTKIPKSKMDKFVKGHPACRLSYF